jgi:hypothetical protein
VTHPRPQEGGAFPTAAQLLLLKAASWHGEPALQAWQQWKERISLETDLLETRSFRLLPLLYHNLRSQGVDDPAMGRLKGIYRLTWYKNRLSFQVLAGVLRLFRSAGIETRVLNGAALTRLYYRDYGLRPMDDLDVLVPVCLVHSAISPLEQAGWKIKGPSLEKLTDDVLRLRHSVSFENPEGRSLELCWRALPDLAGLGDDDDLWANGNSLQIENAPALTLSSAGHLLCICARGIAPNSTSLMCWAADAMTVLSATRGELDWDRLVAQAEKHRLVLPVLGALLFLREALAAPVPMEVIARLRKRPVTLMERVEYRLRIRPAGAWGSLPYSWARNWRRLRLAGSPFAGLRSVVGFPRYLRITQGRDRTGQVWAWAASRTLLRSKKALRNLISGR